MHDGPNQPELSFLEAHLKYLMEDARLTPKLQLERAVGPLLTHFIDRAMSGLTLSSENADLAGHYSLICSEFPLKSTQNNQSTNIDWLLRNETTGGLVFLELKTDVNSMRDKQIAGYEAHINKTSLFIDAITKIHENSDHKIKYDHQLKKLSALRSAPEANTATRLVYLAPRLARLAIPESVRSQFNRVSFSDLPEAINGVFADEWALIRKYLQRLETPLV